MPDGGPTGPDLRVIQIHPTLRCNLRCRHCYSESGPHRAEELPPELVRQVLTDAAAEGYNAVGVSGGEPLLYRPLPELLSHAKALGMTTTVTTNGTVGSAGRLADLSPVVDLLAISLDGLGAEHNRMRGAPHAFESLLGRLPAVRAAGIRYGFIATLTLYNAGELDRLAAFAVEHGAALLQVHPLEEVGYARDHLRGGAPDQRELAVAFLAAARLQRAYAGQLVVQFDAVDWDVARAEPGRLYAGTPVADPLAYRLADLVAPVVLEPDGAVVPLQYGFGRSYAIAQPAATGRTALAAGAARWKRDTYPRFRELCGLAHREILAGGSALTPFANWYGTVSRLSTVPDLVSRPGYPGGRCAR